MRLENPQPAQLGQLEVDIVIVGSGPLGIVTALAAESRGATVLILESGQWTKNNAAQSQSADTLLTPETHHKPEITTARRVGGAGNLWGGRCVPFDSVDFLARPWLGFETSPWPEPLEVYVPYLEEALKLLGAGNPVFSRPLSEISRNDIFRTDKLERWSIQPKTHQLHKTRLTQSSRITLATGISVTGWETGAENAISALRIWCEATKGPARLETSGQVILACGGVQTTRLLLAQQKLTPRLFGGVDGILGRNYMGHINGQIADIVIINDSLHNAFEFHLDDEGSYSRRRITPTQQAQRRYNLSNVAFWPVVPEIARAEHHSGPLSGVFLGLTLPVLGRRLIAESIRLKHVGAPPYRRMPHIRNILTDPLATLGFIPRFLWQRYVSNYRMPGFFLMNPGRRYGLEFHAEHLPSPESRITLDTRRDRTGLHHAKIDFRFSDADVKAVLRAHVALETWLSHTGYGHLIYRSPDEERAQGVLLEAQHGNHQVGTIPMGRTADDGIVNSLGQVFDVPRLHVASTAILPTSSQANPTLMAAQISLRLIDMILKRIGADADKGARHATG